MCVLHAQARTKWSWWNPLRGLVESLVSSSLVRVLLTRSCGDPGEVLPKRSLHDLVQIMWQDLVKTLVTSSLRSPYMILHRSLWEYLLEILMTSSLIRPCMILYRSLWEDLVVTLLQSSLRGPCMNFLGPCEKILWRSCWNHLRGPCSAILNMCCLRRDACMQMLVGCL